MRCEWVPQECGVHLRVLSNTPPFTSPHALHTAAAPPTNTPPPLW